MKHHVLLAKIVGSTLLALLAPFVAPSCATQATGGTDSNTHWLDQCRTDQDCGALVCRCGACTTPCSATTDCTSLGATAVCAASAACSSESKVCVSPCTAATDCPKGGSTFACRSGQCAPAATDGGASGTGAFCPDNVGPDVPCSFEGDCDTSCAGGVPWYTHWSCTNGRWVGTFGLVPCAVDAGIDGGPASPCAPGTRGGDACTSEGAACEMACSPEGAGVRGQLVCRRGHWLAGKGLVSCGPPPAPPQLDAGKDPCAPMDVHPGDGSISFGCAVFYAWDGTRCFPVSCGCKGADCGSAWTTEAECRTAKLGCLPRDVSISCVTGADCSLEPVGCCVPCGQPASWDTVPISVSSAPAWRESQQCTESCIVCDHPPSTVQAVCQGGLCTATDLAPVTGCTADADCVLRAKDCCECGDLTGPDSVVALNGSLRAFYTNGICGGPAQCPACTPHYPARVVARCSAVRHGTGSPADAGLDASFVPPSQGVCYVASTTP